MADSDLIFINGINAASGDYDFPPMTLDDMSNLAQGGTLDEADVKELQAKHKEKTQAHWAVKEGVDPKDVAQTGWGVVFAFADKDKTPAVKEALKPLLDWRRSQAAKIKENRYKEFIGPASYRPKETKNAFLSRHGMGPGPADPDKVPYYLLIVGDPEAIPYKVQYQLDVQYAVGRIHFDNVEDYAQYAHNVVLAEQKSPFLNPKATFFGVANPNDTATNLSAEKLLKPLSTFIGQDKPNWGIKHFAPAECTKAGLGAIINNPKDETALLVAASHGMGFDNGDPNQLRHGGALLCQDWPGPGAHKGAIPESFYFSGDDVSSDANLLGMIAFFFACYGGGTPLEDEFAHKDGKRKQIAPKPFVANLPRRMLQQGALAVFAHVERAWGTSFMWDRGTDNTETFKSSLKRLLEGGPIGYAFEYFNERYAELSSELTVILEELQFGGEPDKEDLVQKWTANNDARSFVIIGDPAARLAVPFMGGAPSVQRPGLATELAAFAVAPAPAADPISAAQTNLDALTSKIQSQAKEAFKAVEGLQAEADVRTVPSDIAFDSGKGVMTGAAQLATTARLDPTGAAGSWDIQIEIKVTAKKK